MGSVNAHFSTPAEAENFKGIIVQELNKQNELISKNYQLKLSIGMAAYEPSMQHIRDFISAADKDLYEKKTLAHKTANEDNKQERHSIGFGNR